MTDHCGRSTAQAPPLIQSNDSSQESRGLSRTLCFSGTSWGPLRALGRISQNLALAKSVGRKDFAPPVQINSGSVDAKDWIAFSSARTGDGMTREQVGDQLERDLAEWSTSRGPITVNFAFAAMCSDALRCAGMRSSGGLWAIFHGDNTGSNPVGDANRINNLIIV
jgi:hypothetical protein